MVEKAQQQKFGEAGLRVFLVGKQREREMLGLNRLFMHTVHSVEWYCPCLEYHFKQCGKPLRDMPGLCLLDDSRPCQVDLLSLHWLFNLVTPSAKGNAEGPGVLRKCCLVRKPLLTP